MKKCLIVDKMHESIVPLLSEIGYEADYHPQITRQEVLEIISQYQGIIVRSKLKIDQEFIEYANQLQFVARAGAGLDQLDEAALHARNIHIFNAPEGNRDALAEHAIGMLLNLLNHINQADQQIRTGIWNREGNRGVELIGKTVGIIGYGHMGQAFARRLVGFGVKVLAYDKYRQNYGDAFAREATMATIFQQADILSLHVPLTEETNFLVDESYLNQFSKNIFIINTARGKVIKLDSLVSALSSGHVQGAALDVLENEKLDQLSPEQQITLNELQQSERVLFTPHVAGWTFESYEKINQVLVRKINALDLA
ncbi:2-hydroxyacid dehydrogenase [Tunicatimonas pelagia]|uniref:2-hydroxyacid dehydrogenase n=1 Tax=Tunicatimonas pelagia TaxID=931531 RepID=UPI002665D2D8|nr:2-hydroxyacid dehydrogenase [Tunicatimonas pelagia]WKN44472.1 2-hydroxyacid dehydrogenase [Tunicatimonas pelagia]